MPRLSSRFPPVRGGSRESSSSSLDRKPGRSLVFGRSPLKIRSWLLPPLHRRSPPRRPSLPGKSSLSLSLYGPATAWPRQTLILALDNRDLSDPGRARYPTSSCSCGSSPAAAPRALTTLSATSSSAWSRTWRWGLTFRPPSVRWSCALLPPTSS